MNAITSLCGDLVGVLLGGYIQVPPHGLNEVAANFYTMALSCPGDEGRGCYVPRSGGGRPLFYDPVWRVGRGDELTAEAGSLRAPK